MKSILSEEDKKEVYNKAMFRFEEHEDPDENTLSEFLMEETELSIIKKLEKEIDDTYKNIDMGKTIPIFIQRLKESLFQER